MFQQLINHSTDLNRLSNEGFNIAILSGHLLVKDIPYVNSLREIKYGMLVMPLDLAGDVTIKPSTHVCHFSGEHPCDTKGNSIKQIQHQSEKKQLAEGIVIDHSFSAKPHNSPSGYSDFYEKVKTYSDIISSFAKQIDSNVTTNAFPRTVSNNESVNPFNYIDTASSRVGIMNISKKLEIEDIAIVGLGGTGSYLLDLIAKTPVKSIHLFDADIFLQHNAFRSPGAPSIEELKLKIPKVTYFKNIYSKMHRDIYDYPYYIDENNNDILRKMSFVFICIHSGPSKKIIIEKLQEFNVSFIDVGMGLDICNDEIGGIIRVTTGTSEKHDHLNRRIAFGETTDNNEYSTNIQIADLNALNAILAVIKWKKLLKFYRDNKCEYHSTYTIDGNLLLNEEK